MYTVPGWVIEQRQRRFTTMRLTTLIRRWIRKRASEMNLSQLVAVSMELKDNITQSLRAEERCRTPGQIHRATVNHFVFPLIEEEILKLEKQRDIDDPNDYLGPFNKLTTGEIRDYFIWKCDHKGGGLDDWKREKLRREKLDQAKAKLAEEGGQLDSGGGDGASGRGVATSDESLPLPKKEVKAYGPPKKKGPTAGNQG